MFRPIWEFRISYSLQLDPNIAGPIETVKPFLKKIEVTIDSTIADQNYPVLAEEILTNAKYQGRVVLV
jgi:hypothetical protein